MTSKFEKSLTVAIVLALLSWTAAFAQQAPPDLTIRTTTRVILVDAIVTDAGSHPVRDLAASDFTIVEDGKPQKISFFSFESPAQQHSALSARCIQTPPVHTTVCVLEPPHSHSLPI